MEAAVQERELDNLSDLEERITRAVQAIATLRGENSQLSERVKTLETELSGATASRDEFQKENGQLEMRLKQATEELSGLRGERKQVKARIEKLLGQLDLLSAN